MPSTPLYTTDRIRNVAVVGHGGSGKTTLIDACCHAAGTSRRHGSSTEGTALTMFTPEEIAHGISMNASVAYAEWQEAKINFIDTPGYLDFFGETRAGIRVADGAVLVIAGPAGVEVGTERVWDFLQERHLPTILFVSMMDRQNADFEQIFRDVKEHLTDKVIPVEVPIGSGEDFRGIINLFTEKAQFYGESDAGKFEEKPIPEEYREIEQRYYQELIETIAATDDTLLEHYLEGDTITRDEAAHALKQAMMRGDLVPLFCGAPNLEWGVRTLMSEIVELMPSPQERPAEVAEGRGGGVVELRSLNSDPLCALIFKTTSEPHVGELSFFRIYGGSVSNGDELINSSTGQIEKLAHLSIGLGKERNEVDMLRAGDIGVVAKLRNSHTNDTLSSPAHPLTLQGVDFPQPDITVAITAENRADEDKLSHALHMLHEEDPCFSAQYDPNLRQTIARGCGEMHLDVSMERMRRKYNVGVTMREPRIPYRETIRSIAEAHGRHKKQSGGRGQFGDCHLRLKPLPRGEGYRFTDAIVGGVIPGKYIPAVDKGVQESAERGILAGFPVVDFEAECFFGSYHSVDSSEIAFKIAGSLAFQEAAANANPAILEPILDVEVLTPEEFLGDVIGDLNQRRGRILGIEPAGRAQRVRALVPQSELYKYATSLRSLTQGRAIHSRRFSSYEEVPQAEVQKVVDVARKEREAEVAAAR